MINPTLQREVDSLLERFQLDGILEAISSNIKKQYPDAETVRQYIMKAAEVSKSTIL